MTAENKSGGARKGRWMRYRFLIDPKLQLPLIIYFLVFPAFINGFLYWRIKSLLQLVLMECQQFKSTPLSALELLFPNDVSRLNSLFIEYGLIMTVFFMSGGILVTHRIVGPIYRLKMHMRKVLNGENPGKLFFRKNDYFQEVADQLNEVLEKK